MKEKSYISSRTSRSAFIMIGFFVFLGLAHNVSAAPGDLDLTFDPGDGANSDVHAIVVQNDGKILIGGDFTSYDNTSVGYIARLNADGSLDTSFNTGTGFDYTVYSIAIQSDGKIIVGGDFYDFNGTTRAYIARLNSDGSLDTSFDPGFTLDYTVYDISIQSDGKLIIGGRFTYYDINPGGTEGVARLNTNGSLDFTFDAGSGANSYVKATAIQSDGKIVIGGWFSQYDGVNRYGIARINTDGSLDTTFDTVGVDFRVEDVAVQSDGKIIIAGQFMSYDGVTQYSIARANTDGSIDTSFDAGSDIAEINDLVLQSDGKIVASGVYSTGFLDSYDVFRLNTDGTEDTSFNMGMADATNTIALQSDGKIVIGGSFLDYNGTTRYGIARVESDDLSGSGPSDDGQVPMNINTEVKDTLTLDCYDSTNGTGNYDVTLGTTSNPGFVTAGTPAVGTSTCDTTTNDDQGYYLTVENDNGVAYTTLTHTDPNTSTVYEIQDLTPWNETTMTTQNWNAPTTKGLGFSIISFPDTDTSNNTFDGIWNETNQCPEGTTPDSNNYAGIPDTPQAIAAVPEYSANLTTTEICYKVDVPASQPSGIYTGSVTYTATSDASSYLN